MFIDIPELFSKLPSFLRRHKFIQLLLFISPESCIQLVQYNDTARLYADLLDAEARNCLITKKFEPEFFLIAKPFLSKGGVLFDVGANFGFCSFGIMDSVPELVNIDYHLFEANSDICELLLKSASLHPIPTIKINNFCVTNKRGISRLRVLKSSWGQSFISDDGQQEVTNLVLDEYIQKNLIKKINFMKLDIEGWEVFALRGAIRSLEKGVVEVIYVEAISDHIQRVGLDISHLLEVLKDTGFQIFYCKNKDFENGTADESRAFTLDVHGYPLKLASLDLNNLPSKLHTDLLAIHRSTDFLQ